MTKALIFVLWLAPASAWALATGTGCCTYTATCCVAGFCATASGTGCGAGSIAGSCSQVNINCLSYIPGGVPAGCTVTAALSNFTCTNINVPGLPAGDPSLPGSVGGLVNDLGATNVVGPEQGQAPFIPNSTKTIEAWDKQAKDKRKARAANNRRVEQRCRGGGGSARYIISPCQARALGNKSGLERAYNFMTPWFSAGKTKSEPVESPIGSLTGDFVPPTTAGYEDNFLASAGSVLEPPAAPIAPDAAVPISGPGVTTGKPDTPPPGTPEPVRTERGVSPCRKGWWLNSASRTCYASEPSCRAGSNDPGESCTVPDP